MELSYMYNGGIIGSTLIGQYDFPPKISANRTVRYILMDDNKQDGSKDPE
jgi:hypothetical protein